MSRSLVAVLVDTIRTQAAMADTYFQAKADGLDEFTLRRLQQTVVDGSASALDIATNAEALERHALTKAERHIADLRAERAPLSLAPASHPEPPPSAA